MQILIASVMRETAQENDVPQTAAIYLLQSHLVGQKKPLQLSKVCFAFTNFAILLAFSFIAVVSPCC